MSLDHDMGARARGFTLMEIMVAVTITAIIGGLVATAFSTAFKAREEVESQAERYRELRTGLNRMAREVEMAFVSDRYDVKRFRDYSDRPTLFVGERDRLLFSYFGHQRMYRDAKESDQGIVEYRIGHDPDDPDRQALLRREKGIIDGEPEHGGAEDVLIGGVKKLEVEYWDPKRKDWQNQWSTRMLEHKDNLPDRVRINVFAVDEYGKEQKYSVQSKVFMTQVISGFGN